jgi:hypothetical protein
MVPTLVEWDADIPAFDRVCLEAATAREIVEKIDGTDTRRDPDVAEHAYS